MAFDLITWKADLKTRFKDWKPRMQAAGVSSVYGFVSAMTLWPVVEAFQKGDIAAVMSLGGVLASLGSNLLANRIQGWKDESDAAVKLAEEVASNEALRTEIDAVLQELDALDIAQETLPAADREWFTHTLRQELSAWGKEIVTVGPRGVMFSGAASGNIIATGDHITIQIGQKQTGRDEPGAPDPGNLRSVYLSRLIEKAGYLSLEGVDPRSASEAHSQMKLSAIYTALLTLSSETKEELILHEQGIERQAKRVSILEQLNQHARLVLMGDPGSGKSTFINFLAICLAGEALGQADVNLGLLTAPVPIEDEKEPQAQSWDHGVLLPVTVILRDFAARGLPSRGETATAEHLWRFIVAELESASLGDFAPALRQELIERPTILLLDGLDEVPSAQNHRQQIRDAVVDFTKTYKQCRVLVTSRTYAYQKQDWRLPGFAETILAPFSDSQIRSFVENWYEHISETRGQEIEDARGKAALLQNAIFASDRLKGLAKRPLLLTLMASLHAWRGGTLPDKREQLYADTVDLLLDNWESPKIVRNAQGEMVVLQPSLGEWLKIDRNKMRRLLHELAYNAHAGQSDLVGTADISEGDLVSGLMKLTRNLDVASNPTLLVDYLSQRAGLLLPRGEGVYTFPHRTFQEYLAACHLTDHGYPDEVAELARKDPTRWREVAMLAGAKAASGTTAAIWTLVEALCYQDHLRLSDLEDVWGACLAGQALVETAELDDLNQRNQAKVTRVKNWLVEIIQSDVLPGTERALAGRSLAHLDDPRLEINTLEDMRFCAVPAGPFRMGEVDNEHEVDLPYYLISRYPITNAHYEFFVESKGYAEAEYWQEAQTAGYWEDGQFKGRFDNQPRNRPFDYGEPYHLANHPVVGVSWYEALAFTRWLTDHWQEQNYIQGDWQVYLPSEAQWEKAARGGLTIPNTIRRQSAGAGFLQDRVETQSNSIPSRIYPWGDEFDVNKVNNLDTGIGSTSAVGSFFGGASPYGVEDISGNVWEWCSSLYKKYPFDAKDGREDMTPGGSRVLRGGSFINSPQFVRCAYRYSYNPDFWSYNYGFRVIVSPSDFEL